MQSQFDDSNMALLNFAIVYDNLAIRYECISVIRHVLKRQNYKSHAEHSIFGPCDALTCMEWQPVPVGNCECLAGTALYVSLATRWFSQ